MKYLILFSTFVIPCFATRASPNLIFRRQTGGCPTGFKTCGDGCVETAYTCCPDGSGGCGPTENCQLGNNNEYLCCPKGETCNGAGGVQTSYITDSSSYITTTSPAYAVTTTTQAAVTGGSSACDAGWKVCGSGCIPNTWSCCPDNTGGCDPSVDRCWLGDNGNYGCCPNTYTEGCTGTAGAPTSLASDFTDATTSRTTSRALSLGSSTPVPAGTSTTRSSTTSRSTTRTTSASTSTNTNTATTSAAGSANDAHQTINNPLASLFSLIMAAVALVA